MLEAPLAEIVRGAPLADMRRTICQTVWVPKAAAGRCPQSCVPDSIPPACPQSCELFIAACEPDETEEPETEELADFGSSVGCDVIDLFVRTGFCDLPSQQRAARLPPEPSLTAALTVLPISADRKRADARTA